MDKVRVTKKFTFDMAHALYGHDGPCRNIHGHTYHLSVTIMGVPLSEEGASKDGMVMDFTDLKKLIQQEILHYFDHALVLNGNSPHKNQEVLYQQFTKILLVPFQPSCENLLIEIKNRLLRFFDTKHQLVAIRLDETPTSYAEWHWHDNMT